MLCTRMVKRIYMMAEAAAEVQFSLSLKLCGSCHAFNFGKSFWKKNLKMGAFIKRLSKLVNS